MGWLHPISGMFLATPAQFLKGRRSMMEAIKFSVVQGIDALCTQVMPEVVRLACMAFIVLAIYNAGRGTK